MTVLRVVGRTRFELVTNGLKGRYAITAKEAFPLCSPRIHRSETPFLPALWRNLPTMMTEEPRLLQDETQTYDSKALSRWFASRPNARQEAREVAAALASLPTTSKE